MKDLAQFHCSIDWKQSGVHLSIVGKLSRLVVTGEDRSEQGSWAACSGRLFRVCEMDKNAWQKSFSSVFDFAIKKSKKIHIFLI